MSNTAPILPSTLQPTVAVEHDRVSLNAFSDGETTGIVNGGMMKKHKSADDLGSGLSAGRWRLKAVFQLRVFTRTYTHVKV